ncbi:hypothetical protein M5689_019829 [Euphorbia peplus]|nr:hypothetical protein M5689_019829 [Euphorbia peplus]
MIIFLTDSIRRVGVLRRRRQEFEKQNDFKCEIAFQSQNSAEVHSMLGPKFEMHEKMNLWNRTSIREFW